MARNGFRIFDSDTHVGPYMDVLERYLSGAEKEKLAAWEPHRSKSKGFPVYTKGQRRYLRKLGTAQPEPDKGGYMAGFTGAKREREPALRGDHEPAERIKDLDYEGVDVNLTLPSGWFGTWTAGDDVALESAMYRAYHRWMADYCGAYPERLGGVILVGTRDVQSGLAEIKRCGKERWAWAVMAYAPYGVPLDHPSLEPVWAAAQDHDLAVVLHTFTVMPPYAPGGLDTWDNLWMHRSDEHAETIASAIPQLKAKPSGYVTGGRYFQSIEIPEGDKLTNAVIDLVGEDVLMYASDYPHGESHFPKSVEKVLDWDNAVRLYARCGLQ